MNGVSGSPVHAGGSVNAQPSGNISPEMSAIVSAPLGSLRKPERPRLRGHTPLVAYSTPFALFPVRTQSSPKYAHPWVVAMHQGKRPLRPTGDPRVFRASGCRGDVDGDFWQTESWLAERKPGERHVLSGPLGAVVRMRCGNDGRRGPQEEPGP